MALRNTYNLKSFEADTAAEISDVVFKKNDMVLAIDTEETKKGDGETSFSDLPVFGSGGGSDAVAWSAITGTERAGQIPTLPIGKISGLQTELNNKIAYADLSGVSDSTATDVSGLVADFNALLAILKGA